MAKSKSKKKADQAKSGAAAYGRAIFPGLSKKIGRRNVKLADPTKRSKKKKKKPTKKSK